MNDGPCIVDNDEEDRESIKLSGRNKTKSLSLISLIIAGLCFSVQKPISSFQFPILLQW
jgi:hypothetical protein